MKIKIAIAISLLLLAAPVHSEQPSYRQGVTDSALSRLEKQVDSLEKSQNDSAMKVIAAVERFSLQIEYFILDLHDEIEARKIKDNGHDKSIGELDSSLLVMRAEKKKSDESIARQSALLKDYRTETRESLSTHVKEDKTWRENLKQGKADKTATNLSIFALVAVFIQLVVQMIPFIRTGNRRID